MYFINNGYCYLGNRKLCNSVCCLRKIKAKFMKSFIMRHTLYIDKSFLYSVDLVLDGES